MKAIAEDQKVVCECFNKYNNNNLVSAEGNGDLRCTWFATLKATGNAVSISVMLVEAGRKVNKRVIKL